MSERDGIIEGLKGLLGKKAEMQAGKDKNDCLSTKNLFRVMKQFQVWMYLRTLWSLTYKHRALVDCVRQI